MKRSIIALLLLAMTFATATPADATASIKTFFRIHNGTDKYVSIVTYVFPVTELRPWCIAPHADFAHDLVTTLAVTSVQALVSAGGCGHTPTLLNSYLRGPRSIGASGNYDFFAVVGFAGGVYTFTGPTGRP